MQNLRKTALSKVLLSTILFPTPAVTTAHAGAQEASGAAPVEAFDPFAEMWKVFRQKADEEGHCRTALFEYRRTPAGKTLLTPHRLVASLGGKAAGRWLEMDRAREVEVPLYAENGSGTRDR